MDLVGVVQANRDQVMQVATERFSRSHLHHYEAVAPDQSLGRLDDLLNVVLDCLERRTLVPIWTYSETIAGERFNAGFDIAEVQAAFNVLEEALWRVVISRLAPEDLLEATGLLGTTIGAGKDNLARTWLCLATSHHVPSLDMIALFEGSTS
jgi:hypothetical protein